MYLSLKRFSLTKNQVSCVQETWNQWLRNAGPTSQTLAQYWSSIGSAFVSSYGLVIVCLPVNHVLFALCVWYSLPQQPVSSGPQPRPLTPPDGQPGPAHQHDSQLHQHGPALPRPLYKDHSQIWWVSYVNAWCPRGEFIRVYNRISKHT